MKKGIIVQGDPLSGGGKVEEGTGYEVNGFKIALLGDPVSCAVPFHGAGTIIEGDPDFLVDNKPVALHGHKVSCGCTLVSVQLAGLSIIEESEPEEEENSFLDKLKAFIFDCDKVAAQEEQQKELLNLLANVTGLDPIKHEYVLQAMSQIGSHHGGRSGNLKNLFDVFEKDYCYVPETNNNNHTELVGGKNRELNSPPTDKKDNDKFEYVPLEGGPKVLRCEGNKFTGGPHSETTQPTGDEMDSHHIPPKSAYKGSKMNPDSKAKEGPAMKMDPGDHARTKSKRSLKFRKEQKELIQQGKLKEAIQRDIDDVRKIAADIGKPDKYECAIKEMIDYINTLNPNDFIVK